MPVTLVEAKKNFSTDMEKGVIDEFRKASIILDMIEFHDAVSPVGGGASLTYGYTRLATQPSAGFRSINEEYTPSVVTKTPVTVELKVFGGSFEIDRVIASLGGFIDEVALQVAQKVKATRCLFHDTFINGSVAGDAETFDGIDTAVTGSSTEVTSTTAVSADLSTSANIDSNYKAFMDKLDEFLALLDAKPTLLLGNSKLIARVKSVARRAGYMTASEDAFGRKIDAYDGIPLVDMGEKPGSTDLICPLNTRTINSVSTSGLADLYAVRLGMDGLHGVSLAGQSPLKIWLPKFEEAGAVKKGEVEMVSAIALKATKSAGVLRNIKVQ